MLWLNSYQLIDSSPDLLPFLDWSIKICEVGEILHISETGQSPLIWAVSLIPVLSNSLLTQSLFGLCDIIKEILSRHNMPKSSGQKSLIMKKSKVY